MDFLAAQKISAALHYRDFQVGCEMFLNERDVLAEKLFLEGFGCGGNHHATPAAQRRNQIGKRLSGAGAGLDDNMAMALESIVDDFSHLKLRAAMLVTPAHALFEKTARAEHLGHAWKFLRLLSSRGGSGGAFRNWAFSRLIHRSGGSLNSLCWQSFRTCRAFGQMTAPLQHASSSKTATITQGRAWGIQCNPWHCRSNTPLSPQSGTSPRLRAVCNSVRFEGEVPQFRRLFNLTSLE